MKNFRPTGLLVVLLFSLVLTTLAQAADVNVNCNDPKKNNSINAALASLSKGGPNTIRVSGTCNEAVVIDGFDRLTLVGNPTATVNDPTPTTPELEDTTVILITDSDRVGVQGITVNGGAAGITCQAFSVCILRDVHVHNSVGAGVQYARSSGFIFDNTVIEDNGGNGLTVVNGSNVSVFGDPVGPIIQDNGFSGVNVTNDSHFQLTVGTVLNNGINGINAQRGSNVNLFGTVTGNGSHGLSLSSSTATIQEATITGNTGNGVRVANLSLARFLGATVSGNSAPDVNCTSTTAVTTEATTEIGAGTTNCTEPAP